MLLNHFIDMVLYLHYICLYSINDMVKFPWIYGMEYHLGTLLSVWYLFLLMRRQMIENATIILFSIVYLYNTTSIEFMYMFMILVYHLE